MFEFVAYALGHIDYHTARRMHTCNEAKAVEKEEWDEVYFIIIKHIRVTHTCSKQKLGGGVLLCTKSHNLFASNAKRGAM